ncbi:hypothetical protein PS1_038627 [Malus domestica]
MTLSLDRGVVDGRSRLPGSSRSILTPRGARLHSARGWDGSAVILRGYFMERVARDLRCVTLRLLGKLVQLGLLSWLALITGLIMLLLNLMPK